jgi:MscS family membrane protein
LLIIAMGFGIATSPALLDLAKPVAEFLASVTSTLRVVVVCLLVQGIGQGLVDISQEIAISTGKQTSAIIYGFYKKAITVGAVILGLFMILKIWGFDVSSLLAGLGIGGLALSLAAQDTFSNLLGGITILTDKAFEIGDVISTPEIEGTVEQIGFRSTKVRTFAQAQVNIPNAKLSNSFVTNLSRMGKRRIRFNLNIPYSVSTDRIEKLAARLTQELAGRESLMDDGILIYLEKLGPTAQEVLFQCFVRLVDYNLYMSEQQAILFIVRSILDELEIPFAMQALNLQMPPAIEAMLTAQSMPIAEKVSP